MQRRHRKMHLVIWIALALLLPLLLAAAAVVHRAQSSKIAPVRLAPPSSEAQR